MPSNREAYFEALKMNVPTTVINFALQEINVFTYLELTQNFDKEIKDYSLFKSAIKRFLEGEMIEYIFSKAYFLSLPLYVDKNVLIPRQETEQLVNSVIQRIKAIFKNQSINVADVCTGSGAIGVAISKALPTINMFLTDISKEALDVAKINAKKLGNDKIKLYLGDMLDPLIENNIKLDVLICNPPYIDDIQTIDSKTWNQEPHLALLASPNTLFYEKIFKDYEKVMNDKFLLAFEIGEDMEASLSLLINKYFKKCEYEFMKDVYGKTRFLFIKQE